MNLHADIDIGPGRVVLVLPIAASLVPKSSAGDIATNGMIGIVGIVIVLQPIMKRRGLIGITMKAAFITTVEEMDGVPVKTACVPSIQVISRQNMTDIVSKIGDLFVVGILNRVLLFEVLPVSVQSILVPVQVLCHPHEEPIENYIASASHMAIRTSYPAHPLIACLLSGKSSKSCRSGLRISSFKQYFLFLVG